MIHDRNITPERIERALLLVAEIVQHRPEAMPIFERLEQELALTDPLARARALLAKRKATIQ